MAPDSKRVMSLFGSVIAASAKRKISLGAKMRKY